jgi:hypothetical protein
MKKIVFRFWIINFLISIALFVIYRIVIAQTNSTDRNFLETLLFILNAFLNIGFTIIYLIVMIFCSFVFFLNLNANIRNNYLLSFLTFLGVPSVCVIYLIIKTLIDVNLYNESPLTTFVVFSIIYLFITVIEFLLFRKKIKKTTN